MSVNPVRFPDDKLLGLPSAGGSTPTTSGGIAEAGMFLPAPDGTRLMYGTAGSTIIYILIKGKSPADAQYAGVWTQGAMGFAEDVGVGGPCAAAAGKLVATQSVIKGWLEGFTTVVGCFGGPVGWAVFGMNAAVTAGKVYRNWKVIEDGMVALLTAERSCRVMPVFHAAVLRNLVFAAVEKAAAWRLGDLLEGESGYRRKVAGKLAGVAIGALTGAVFEDRLKVIVKLLREVAVKVAEHVKGQPDYYTAGFKFELSGDQVEKLAKHHVLPILAEARSPIDMVQGKAMVREFVRHGPKVLADFKDIIRALEALG